MAGLTERGAINEGVPGEDSGDGLKRLPGLLDEYKPELLILIHGGNDMLRKIPSEQTIDHRNKMIAEARNRHIKRRDARRSQPQLFMLSRADFYEGIAENQHILTDLDTLTDILGDKRLISDMIHPNDAGYQRMAVNIFILLREVGALISEKDVSTPLVFQSHPAWLPCLGHRE